MKIKNIDIIVQTITNMIDTNYSYRTDGIAENFIDWCENGAIFEDMEFFKEKDTKECKQIMQEIAPFVNALTNKLYELYEKGE